MLHSYITKNYNYLREGEGGRERERERIKCMYMRAFMWHSEN